MERREGGLSRSMWCCHALKKVQKGYQGILQPKSCLPGTGLQEYSCQVHSLTGRMAPAQTQGRISESKGRHLVTYTCSWSFVRHILKVTTGVPKMSINFPVLKTPSDLSCNWLIARAKYIPLWDTDGVNLDACYFNILGFKGLHLRQLAPSLT